MNVLFLGYGREKTRLIEEIESLGHRVTHTEAAVDNLSGFDVTVSFGYRHILTRQTLMTVTRPPINLHISYLPYNRGAHPLFWAAMEETPIGVTIHEIDEGIDTGPICFQKLVEIDQQSETFVSAYAIVKREIERLFLDNISALLDLPYTKTAQTSNGTFRRSSELPASVSWDEVMAVAVRRLRSESYDERAQPIPIVAEALNTR